MPPHPTSAERYRASPVGDESFPRTVTSLPRGQQNSVIVCHGCDRDMVTGHRPGDEALLEVAISCPRCGTLNDPADAVLVTATRSPSPAETPGPASHSTRLRRRLDDPVPQTRYDE